MYDVHIWIFETYAAGVFSAQSVETLLLVTLLYISSLRFRLYSFYNERMQCFFL